MLKDLKKMRELEVYPRDVQARNYVGGFLVDMSVAMTEPHYLFDIRPKWRVERWKEADLISYDNMMEDENIKDPPRATRNETYHAKLRSSKRGLPLVSL